MNILNIAYSLPEKREYVAEAAQRLNIPKEQAKVMEKFFGLKKLPIDSDIVVMNLLLKSANECFDTANISRKKIKYLIYAHTANQVMPFGESCVITLQRKLKLNNAISFSTALSKCASAFVAFKISHRLFNYLNDDDFILILAADISFTKILQYIPGTTITTDGACSLLLAKNHINNRLIQIEIENHGEFAGGIWNDKVTEQLFESQYSIYLSKVIKKVVLKSGLVLTDIKLIIPHNVNTLSWLQIMKHLSLPSNKVFLDNVSETAHCFGVDPFLNLKDVLDKKKIQKGDYYILATVGLGATFAAMVFQY